MPDVIVPVYTWAGIKVGYFVNPKVERFAQDHYSICGHFCQPDGSLPDRIEFNPQVLPYRVDLSGLEEFQHAELSGVYVQRGRQPVAMTGVGRNKPNDQS